MKNYLLLLILTASFYLVSCSSDSPANPSTSGNFTLKYEIITSSPIVADPLGGFITLGYFNGTGAVVADYSFTSGTTWSKEVTVTTPNRPFNAWLYALAGGGVYLNAPGTVTCNIYVNGTRVTQSVNPTNPQGGYNSVPISISYEIK